MKKIKDESSKMKERPILFSGAMVRAILKGTKTQTRRVVKPQPPYLYEKQNAGVTYEPIFTDKAGECHPGEPVFGIYNDEAGWVCPYGKPVDRLWVRETHQVCAGCRHVNCRADEQQHGECSLCGEGLGKWRPSIFMQRELSRITLEVVSVRVERLQDISEADAMAEGVESAASYAKLWESINGAGSWAVNPWVWVVEFRKTAEWGQQNEDEGLPVSSSQSLKVSSSPSLQVSQSDEGRAAQ